MKWKDEQFYGQLLNMVDNHMYSTSYIHVTWQMNNTSEKVKVLLVYSLKIYLAEIIHLLILQIGDPLPHQHVQSHDCIFVVIGYVNICNL